MKITSGTYKWQSLLKDTRPTSRATGGPSRPAREADTVRRQRRKETSFELDIHTDSFMLLWINSVSGPPMILAYLKNIQSYAPVAFPGAWGTWDSIFGTLILCSGGIQRHKKGHEHFIEYVGIVLMTRFMTSPLSRLRCRLDFTKYHTFQKFNRLQWLPDY